ncbi:MAG: hypothetical protein JXI33_05135 [Candidatus Aminicenantes bacterium]|nr:hypothetical protein [Candidatus Aminicenantes bacterium]
MKILRAILFFLLAAARPLAALDVPGDNFSPGWQRSDQGAMVGPAGLYNVIDGGAELFLEMGFVQLQVQKYSGAGTEIAIEAYRMENAAAALGIYLLTCSRETPLPGLNERHSGDRFQIIMLKNDYLIQINNFNGRQELLPVMIQLARQTAASIPTGAPVRELDILPAANQVPKTARLLRGPYSLQAVYTLGEGDVLRLGGEIFAAAAEYREPTGAAYTMIVVPYPEAALTRAAFDNLRGHLDRYIHVVGEGTDFFNFKDFQNDFGRAEIRENRLVIMVKLAQLPDSRLE